MTPSAQFSRRFVSSGIGASNGILRGVTVAEIGEATGHFAFVDRLGNVVGVGGFADASSFPGAVRKLPLCMDAQSLAGVATAGQRAGRVRVREDHDDSIASRAGYAENFRAESGKVVCDLNIFDAYVNRATFLETTQKTPELIGLSGDFKFTAEIVGERALMRVGAVEAVDIVDEGALTPGGLR